ncbi:OLC1v1028878C1 [Oldenlandia corymbosa var. corymbosa]|uniref:OLC1v1028878C1 n=1 Tax=Oldenlandia corymbosa var. corymbosa TaxID=529605 RepID=A0AAV1CEC5_OLDCO|nr:OLC1v1028878C1 [Oldenlandia corymbosa var. corymbosa]
MGFLSHKVGSGDLEAGDHIYTWRTGFSYSHHGIYVGGKKVVHFTREHISCLASGIFATSLSISVSSSLSSPSCSESLQECPMPDCGFRQTGSGVVLSCIDCFLAGGTLYRFEYGISRPAFIVKLRGGTCTTANSDSPDVVIHRAVHLLQHGFGSYNVFENNCEDFALYCKTGLLVNDKITPGRSGQVSGLICAPLAGILSSPLRLLMSNPVSIAAAGVGLYTMSRYVTDIGVRSDVIRVEVEDMVSSHCYKGPREPSKDAQCRKRLHDVEERDFQSSKRQMFC